MGRTSPTSSRASSASRRREAPRRHGLLLGVHVLLRRRPHPGHGLRDGPNGDGSTADAADIINMSLGSPYGPAPDDDLSAASDNAARQAPSSWRRPATAATSRTSSVASERRVGLLRRPDRGPVLDGLRDESRNGGPFVPTEAVAQSWSKPLTATDAGPSSSATGPVATSTAACRSRPARAGKFVLSTAAPATSARRSRTSRPAAPPSASSASSPRRPVRRLARRLPRQPVRGDPGLHGEPGHADGHEGCRRRASRSIPTAGSRSSATWSARRRAVRPT